MNPRRLESPWRCPECPFMTSWRPAIPMHEKSHTGELKVNAEVRHRRGRDHPLWTFRWKPLDYQGDAWMHTVVEAENIVAARRLFNHVTANKGLVSHQGPAMEVK